MLLSLQLFRRYKQHLANSAPNGSKCSELQGLLLCYPPSIYTGFTQALHPGDRRHFHSHRLAPGLWPGQLCFALACQGWRHQTAPYLGNHQATWLGQTAARQGPEKMSSPSRRETKTRPRLCNCVQRQITCTLKYVSIEYNGKWWVKKNSDCSLDENHFTHWLEK